MLQSLGAEEIIIETMRMSPTAKLPEYAHEDGDVGADLFADQHAIIEPGDTKTIKTGIALMVPLGYGAFIWDKSGLASKDKMTTLAGVVDSNYREEVGVVLTNLSREIFIIARGDKIAQMVLAPIIKGRFREVMELPKTSRKGGWGSTGKR